MNINSKAEITCVSNESVSWRFQGDGYFAKNVKFNGEENGTLIIVNTNRDNSGTYSCVTKDGEEREYVLNSSIMTSGRITSCRENYDNVKVHF